jgi:hypothetical protein
MKKIIYIILLAISSSLVATSCTEENVEPKVENGGAEGLNGRI